MLKIQRNILRFVDADDYVWVKDISKKGEMTANDQRQIQIENKAKKALDALITDFRNNWCFKKLSPPDLEETANGKDTKTKRIVMSDAGDKKAEEVYGKENLFFVPVLALKIAKYQVSPMHFANMREMLLFYAKEFGRTVCLCRMNDYMRGVCLFFFFYFFCLFFLLVFWCFNVCFFLFGVFFFHVLSRIGSVSMFLAVC